MDQPGERRRDPFGWPLARAYARRVEQEASRPQVPSEVAARLAELAPRVLGYLRGAGVPDPEGSHLLVLARDTEGYARLASVISAAQLAGRTKGKPDYPTGLVGQRIALRRGQPETRVMAQGLARLFSAEEACAHLTVEGRCPEEPREVLMLAGDLERNLLEIGDEVVIDRPLGTVTVVGTYQAPEDEADFWFDLSKFASIPAVTTASGVSIPYQAAPLVTVPETFGSIV